LQMLARDDNPNVRYAIADNHNISIAILKRLAEDENPYIACRAAKTLLRVSGSESDRRRRRARAMQQFAWSAPQSSRQNSANIYP
jgi:hypothetical protein